MIDKLVYTVMLFVVLALSGCALSPQQVSLIPAVTVSVQPYGRGRPVIVDVVDSRPGEVIGSRGGVYGDTSLITMARGDVESVVLACRDILAQLGFDTGEVDPRGASASRDPAVKFTVTITELTYSSPDKIYANSVNAQVELKLTVASRGETFNSRFRTTNSERFLSVPGEEVNVVLINKLFSQTLAKLFQDPQLMAFLQ